MGVHPTSVRLMGGCLTGVYLMGVCLLGVYLNGRAPHGRASDLVGVNLTGVQLMSVHLIDVYFMDVNTVPVNYYTFRFSDPVIPPPPTASGMTSELASSASPDPRPGIEPCSAASLHTTHYSGPLHFLQYIIRQLSNCSSPSLENENTLD